MGSVTCNRGLQREIRVAERRAPLEDPPPLVQAGGEDHEHGHEKETGDGRIYRTRRITLHGWLAECSDRMSDRRYRDTVRAEVDGRTLNGCGGPYTEPYPA